MCHNMSVVNGAGSSSLLDGVYRLEVGRRECLERLSTDGASEGFAVAPIRFARRIAGQRRRCPF